MNGVELMIKDITVVCARCGYTVILDRAGIAAMEAHIKDQHPLKEAP